MLAAGKPLRASKVMVVVQNRIRENGKFELQLAARAEVSNMDRLTLIQVILLLN